MAGFWKVLLYLCIAVYSETDMKHFLQAILVAICLAGCSGTETSENLTSYVDPKIGSGGHGHVFVGANVPFGMVQLGPTSIPQEWDWTSGYHDSDSTVIGFSHTHLNGTGIGDLFDITVMPVTGDVEYARGTEDDPQSGLWSYADRSRECVRPGYYSVPLTRYDITAEMTATNRVGLHRYTFPESEDAGIVIDLQNGGCWDRPTETFIEQCGDNAVRGYRYSTGWADDQRIYFHAEFSKPIEDLFVHSVNYMQLYAKACFKTTEGEQIMMKVALSPTSMEKAEENMQTELPGWNFEAVEEAAAKAWNEELGKIKIETKDEKTRRIFYTALYHTMTAPSTFCDADGSYRGADGQIHEFPGHQTYTTFSLWDTYRAAMPLFSIFQPDRYKDFIETMLMIYREQGRLPVWHLHGCETFCMVGNPGIIPIADAIVKGSGISAEEGFEAMKKSALIPDRGQDLRMKHGYIPCDLFSESVAYDLEYAIADAAIAEAAAYLSDNETDPQKAAEYREDYRYFKERSRSYRHLFDPALGFIRGKDSNGEFRKEYSPFASTHRADDYCEGNGWQYTWLVPHDADGLAGCFGGKEKFLCRLDSLFAVSSEIEGDASPDISGMIGQYAHGNEPSHHIAYLYAMAGEPSKTAEKVRQILETMYSDQQDGLAGNEDVGQMSAWYVLSSLGLYQVEPGSGRYWFGSPVFDKAVISSGAATFTIRTVGNSKENRYIQSVTLNGKPYDKPYIDHKDIAAGGELVFRMRP